jgi:hypothetical protein
MNVLNVAHVVGLEKLSMRSACRAKTTAPNSPEFKFTIGAGG